MDFVEVGMPQAYLSMDIPGYSGSCCFNNVLNELARGNSHSAHALETNEV